MTIFPKGKTRPPLLMFCSLRNISRTRLPPWIISYYTLYNRFELKASINGIFTLFSAVSAYHSTKKYAKAKMTASSVKFRNEKTPRYFAGLAPSVPR